MRCNPLPVQTLAFCQKYDLWLVEDNCDARCNSPCLDPLKFSVSRVALASMSDRVIRWTGTWGDISTLSFIRHTTTMEEVGP